jgi:hypothetical protein
LAKDICFRATGALSLTHRHPNIDSKLNLVRLSHRKSIIGASCNEPMEDQVEAPKVERSDHSTPKIASRKNGGWVIVYDAAILVHYLPEGWT